MTTNFTQFVNVLLQAWSGTATDAELGHFTRTFDRAARYNAQYKNTQQMLLNNSISVQLTLGTVNLTDWHLIVVRCIGKGYISIGGQDGGGGAITSQIPVYGTAALPGIAVFSTYRLTSAPLIVSQQDGSIFDVYDQLCVEDGA